MREVCDEDGSVVTVVRDDRFLGPLFKLVDNGELSVLELHDRTQLCESDLHGLLAEFRAAGLIRETTIDGRRGYVATDRAERAVRKLRSDDDI